MGALEALSLGFQTVFQPGNVLFVFLGIVLGLVVGVLPGIGGTGAVAISLPLTMFMPPTGALIFLGGIYWGAIFAGAITSILFGIPGEPWSVVSILDGRPLAKAGKAALALTVNFTAALLGAWFATLFFTFVAVPLSMLALEIGPPELFAVLLVAFGTFVGLGSGSPFKTLVMMAIGLILSAVGLDIVTGQPRLTFGSVELLKGIDFVPVTVGLFGLGEIIYGALEARQPQQEVQAVRLGLAHVLEGLRTVLSRLWLSLSSAAIGFIVGVLPALGATPASFMAYGLAQRTSREPERFGKGAPEGVLAPESAAGAAAVGSMLPMMTLGIPGSPTAAVIMAGLFMWGLLPGPILFQQHPDFAWGFVASLWVGNLVAYLLCVTATPLLAAIMRIPYAILAPVIVILSTLGAYAVSNSMLDVWVMLAFGVVGFLARKLKYPLAPLVIALVLGTPTENALRQTLILSGGSIGILFTRPLAAVLTVVALVLFFLPLIEQLIRRVRQGSALARQAG